MSDTTTTPPAGIFTTLANLSKATKTITIASPEDVIAEHPEWSPEQLALPEDRRGKPAKVRLELRPGAATTAISIRGMTLAERDAAEKILDQEIPPRVFVEENPEKPGMPVRKVAAGYDETDPAYLAKVRPLEYRQAAWVTLCGVEGMRESIPAATDEEKMDHIMATLSEKLVRFIAGEVWSMSWQAGDAADFFTSAGSASSKS